MKAKLPHVLISCILAAGCVPMGPAHPGSMPMQRGETTHVNRQARPAAPALRRLPNGHYRVRQPWTVNLNGREWHVQKGYTSNGITAPAKLKAELGDGVDRKETWAAVFHDWLFTQPGISRAQADRMFFDLLLAYGVPEQKARMMYNTVSLYTLSKKFR